MFGRRNVSMILVSLLLTAAIAGCGGKQAEPTTPAAGTPTTPIAPTPAVPEKPYYEGKSITLIVPNSPGKGMDTYARMIVPHLQKYLGAKEIVVKNITGAGGVVGINQLWSSKADGLTIAFTSVPTVILAHLSAGEGVQFDSTKFTYLGRASTEPRVLAVGGKSAINTIADVPKMSRAFKFPTQGTDEDFFTMAVIAKALGFKLQTISGYEGNADTALAVIKGDGDGHITGVTDAKQAIEGKDKKPILMISSKRAPEYPSVPTAGEAVPAASKGIVEAIVAINEMHRSFFGPPNMDAAATKAMRAAVTAALQEKSLLDAAAKSGLPIASLGGEEQQAMVIAIAKESQNIVPVLKEAIQSLK